jgi:hypothetical protein
MAVFMPEDQHVLLHNFNFLTVIEINYIPITIGDYRIWTILPILFREYFLFQTALCKNRGYLYKTPTVNNNGICVSDFRNNRVGVSSIERKKKMDTFYATLCERKIKSKKPGI